MAVALTIAGSDSGGGAGIQADIKAMSALGVFGTSAITAITAQNTQTVSAVYPIPENMIRAQIDAVLADFSVGAVKIGMLASASVISVVFDALKDFHGPVVLDPVMIAKSGAALIEDTAISALRALLVPRASLLTPNLPEAARLLELPPAQSAAEKEAQAKALARLCGGAVLLKDGHGQGDICSDILLQEGRITHRLSAPRIATKNTHGTGCTLSSSIAAYLARGDGVAQAVQKAHCYLHKAIMQADTLQVGKGRGPVHHFHAFWEP